MGLGAVLGRAVVDDILDVVPEWNDREFGSMQVVCLPE